MSEEHHDGVQFVFVRLQDGKEDVRYSLHARPSAHYSWGPQTTDLLATLGFRRARCKFVTGDQCFVRAVESGFDVPAFANAFSRAFKDLCEADRHLLACGLFLPLDEGLGYYYGRPSSRRSRPIVSHNGDGHTAQTVQKLKESEDDVFWHIMTWMEDALVKGWTIHHRPKHLPLSPDVCSVLQSLELHDFATCPEFEFEPCWWRHIPGSLRAGDPFVTNAEEAHRIFDALATNFATGIERVIAAEAAVRPFGMTVLQAAHPTTLTRLQRVSTRPSSQQPLASSLPEHFDVAISFAGPQREQAERLAQIVREAGFEVFYDDFYPEQLWGADLPVVFSDVFGTRSRYCVIFVSCEYVERLWTNHERQAAVARAVELRGQAYILPIRVDEVDLPGVPSTLGYVSLRNRSVEEIGGMLVRKLKKE